MTPLIPRAALFGFPDRRAPKISPDGTRLSYLSRVDGVLNVWVGDRDDLCGSTQVTHEAQIPHLRLLGWLLWAYSRCGVSTGVLIGLCAASLRGLATVSRQLWSLSG